MKAKQVVTAALLLFVIGSVAYLVIKETGQQKSAVQKVLETTRPNSEAANTGRELQHKVFVYYFHGNMRCPTCRKFEAYAHEALLKAFPDELKSEKLDWRLINIDEPSNEHFIQDYGITTRSLVVVNMKGKNQKEWKNLQKIWDLVKDKGDFIKYVQEETRDYLEENS